MKKNFREQRQWGLGAGIGEEPQSLRKETGKVNAKCITNVLAPSMLPKPGGLPGLAPFWMEKGLTAEVKDPALLPETVGPRDNKFPDSWPPISASEHSQAKINVGTPWWSLGAGKKSKMSPNAAQSFKAKPHQNHPDRC